MLEAVLSDAAILRKLHKYSVHVSANTTIVKQQRRNDNRRTNGILFRTKRVSPISVFTDQHSKIVRRITFRAGCEIAGSQPVGLIALWDYMRIFAILVKSKGSCQASRHIVFGAVVHATIQRQQTEIATIDEVIIHGGGEYVEPAANHFTMLAAGIIVVSVVAKGGFFDRFL